MLINCDGCAVRGAACGDCVVSVVLGAPPGALEIDESERHALDVLADAGMVPRLRLVPGREPARPPDGAAPLPGIGRPAPRPPAARRRPARHVA